MRWYLLQHRVQIRGFLVLARVPRQAGHLVFSAAAPAAGGGTSSAGAPCSSRHVGQPHCPLLCLPPPHFTCANAPHPHVSGVVPLLIALLHLQHTLRGCSSSTSGPLSWCPTSAPPPPAAGPPVPPQSPHLYSSPLSLSLLVSPEHVAWATAPQEHCFGVVPSLIARLHTPQRAAPPPSQVAPSILQPRQTYSTPRPAAPLGPAQLA